MSHFQYQPFFAEFETLHDPVYLGTGSSTSGVDAIGLIVTPDEYVDAHLTPDQAEAIGRELIAMATAARMGVPS